MKIRTDFVSNSSSSSFIISSQRGDVRLLAQKMGETFYDLEGFDYPWDFDSYVDICLIVKNKNYTEVWNEFKKDDSATPSYNCEFFEDYQTKKQIKRDPEELAWDSITITPIQLVRLATSKVLSKIEKIRFDTHQDNSNECNRYLALLYKFFDSIDCHPDSSDSERSFLNDYEEEFFTIMQRQIKKVGKYTP